MISRQEKRDRYAKSGLEAVKARLPAVFADRLIGRPETAAPLAVSRGAADVIGQPSLDVKIQEKFVGMGPEFDRVDLAVNLVLDPHVDDILGKDIALEQKRVVFL